MSDQFESTLDNNHSEALMAPTAAETAPTAAPVENQQLTLALATAVAYLLEVDHGVVITLEDQLHIVFKDSLNNVNLSPVTTDEQLTPGQIVTVNKPVEVLDDAPATADASAVTEAPVSEVPAEVAPEVTEGQTQDAVVTEAPQYHTEAPTNY